MMHELALVSAFVFYTNFLLVSAAQIGLSPQNRLNEIPLGCELPWPFHGGSINVDEIEYDEDNAERIWATKGSEANFECDPGFVLHGESSTFCLGNNQWDPELPRCQIPPSGCKFPKIFPRGSFNLEEQIDVVDDENIWIPSGYRVNFHCDRHFKLIGVSTVVCNGNNEWKSELPRCQKIYCSTPSPVDGGYWETIRTGPGSFARLKCREGYVLKDPQVNRLVCVEVNQTELDWRGEWPVCQKIPLRCELPWSFHGGSIKIDHFRFDENNADRIWATQGSEVIFECDPGFVLHGESSTVCLGKNQWSSDLPRCQISSPGCKFPKVFPGGSFDPEKQIDVVDDENIWVPPGYGINFHCDHNYKLLVGSKVVCGGNKEWESELPRCQKAYCAAPPPVEGGYWEMLWRGPGSVASLTCSEGYVLKDPQVNALLCAEVNQTELDWRGEWPVCRKLAECSDPGTPAPGTGSRIPPNGTFYEKSSVSYKCEDEFELVGQETINCQEDSTWDFPRARCKPSVTCDDFPYEPHRILKKIGGPQTTDFFVPRDMIDFTCEPGFRPDQGNTLILCRSDGSWDYNLTVCKEILCSSPAVPKNGYLLKEMDDGNYKFGAEIKYRCRHGYRLFGDNWNQCIDSGWKNSPPECEEVTCSDPGSPENGDFSSSSSTFKVNSTVVFSCFDGYKLLGSAERKCMSNGQWDGSLAICTPARTDGCPNPGIPINGFRTGEKSSNFHPGDTVFFHCKHDFTLQGPEDITCQENGLWNRQQPQCIGEYDVDRPEDIKFKLLDKLDTHLIQQDTQSNYSTKNYSTERDKEKSVLDISIKDTGGHLFFYFVFDSSGSVGNDNFQISIKFATALIRRVGVSKHVHVGLVTYGSTARRILSPFNNTMNIVMNNLKNLNYTGGGTATKDAIELVREMVVQSGRTYFTGFKSVVFLVTDGLHNVGGNPEEATKILKDMGVEIYVIGLIGSKKINRNSLMGIATTKDKHVYYTEGYETMEYLVDKLLNDTVDYSHCGISVRNVSNTEKEENVYGGGAATIHWPWMVHLRINKMQGDWSRCGGSIIDNSWILSAAHCFNGIPNEDVTATAGILNLVEETDEIGDRQTRSVERIWLHPQFDRRTLDYDIALLKLKTPLKYGKYIRRICLPPPFSEIEKNSKLYKDNEKAIVIGFGIKEDGTASDELKEVDILIQNEETCRNSTRASDVTITERMFCAGHPDGSRNFCKGDSGGPLMQEVYSDSVLREPYWVQVGVVSWRVKGILCGTKGYYGFYTHVAKLKESVMREIETH